MLLIELKDVQYATVAQDEQQTRSKVGKHEEAVLPLGCYKATEKPAKDRAQVRIAPDHEKAGDRARKSRYRHPREYQGGEGQSLSLACDEVRSAYGGDAARERCDRAPG